MIVPVSHSRIRVPSTQYGESHSGTLSDEFQVILRNRSVSILGHSLSASKTWARATTDFVNVCTAWEWPLHSARTRHLLDAPEVDSVFCLLFRLAALQVHKLQPGPMRHQKWPSRTYITDIPIVCAARLPSCSRLKTLEGAGRSADRGLAERRTREQRLVETNLTCLPS